MGADSFPARQNLLYFSDRIKYNGINNKLILKGRLNMRKGCLYFGTLLFSLMLCSCSNTPTTNNAETSDNETTNETDTLKTIEVSEDMPDTIPFEVVIDKASLESGKEEETTVLIETNIEDWEYMVSSENGKISNIESASFVYAIPKDEDEREDTIKIRLSDYENGVSYEYNIPLFFPNGVSE